MKPKRTHIAAGGTLAALGALAAVAAGAGTGQPATADSAPKAQPVEVRTVVVHRTIRVVRHAKPKQPKALAAPPAAAVTSTPVQIAQVSNPAHQPVATRPAPASTKPLKTATSGGGSSEREHENEHEHESENERHDGGGEDD